MTVGAHVSATRPGTVNLDPGEDTVSLWITGSPPTGVAPIPPVVAQSVARRQLSPLRRGQFFARVHGVNMSISTSGLFRETRQLNGIRARRGRFLTVPATAIVVTSYLVPVTARATNRKPLFLLRRGMFQPTILSASAIRRITLIAAIRPATIDLDPGEDTVSLWVTSTPAGAPAVPAIIPSVIRTTTRKTLLPPRRGMFQYTILSASAAPGIPLVVPVIKRNSRLAAVVTRHGKFNSPVPLNMASTVPAINLFANFVATQGVNAPSGRVTGWADQSGAGWDAIASPSAPFFATDYRGLPTVRFNSPNTTGLTLAAAHSFNARNVSIFIACRMYQSDNSSVFSLLNYGGSAGHLRWAGSPNTLYAVGVNGAIKPRMNPSVFASISAAATTALYSNYESSTGLAAVSPGAACAGAEIGLYVNASYASMDVYEVAIYEGALTGTQITSIVNYFNSRYKLVATNYTKNITFEGDSITAGLGIVQGQSYPLQVLRTDNEDWRMSNLGISGSTIASMTARGANSDSLYEASYTRNVLVVQIGRNDLATLTAQQMYDGLVTYVQARVTVGWEVWVGTDIASSGVGFQATIDSYNAKIKGLDGPGILASGASRVVDFAANPVFSAGSQSNVIYYQGDGTHPTAAGAAVLASIVAQTVAGSSVMSTLLRPPITRLISGINRRGRFLPVPMTIAATVIALTPPAIRATRRLAGLHASRGSFGAVPIAVTITSSTWLPTPVRQYPNRTRNYSPPTRRGRFIETPPRGTLVTPTLVPRILRQRRSHYLLARYGRFMSISLRMQIPGGKPYSYVNVGGTAKRFTCIVKH